MERRIKTFCSVQTYGDFLWEGGTDDDVLIQEREREKRVFGYRKYPKVRIHIHLIPISRERNLVT